MPPTRPEPLHTAVITIFMARIWSSSATGKSRPPYDSHASSYLSALSVCGHARAVHTNSLPETKLQLYIGKRRT